MEAKVLQNPKDARPMFVVNFHPELKTIIRETKYLDQHGFKVPETALNVTLQVRFFQPFSPALTSAGREIRSLCR